MKPTQASVDLIRQAHRHQPREEADDDAVFAAAFLGTLHDAVRGVGNVFRVVGDTTGALTGGSIKAVGATVNVRLLFSLLFGGTCTHHHVSRAAIYLLFFLA